MILLSGLDDPRWVPEALRIGVRGFVLKTQGAEDLLRAIDKVRDGALFVKSRRGAGHDRRLYGRHAVRLRQLSPRERQVLQLVAEGKSTKGIAQALRISVKTASFIAGGSCASEHPRTAGLSGTPSGGHDRALGAVGTFLPDVWGFPPSCGIATPRSSDFGTRVAYSSTP